MKSTECTESNHHALLAVVSALRRVWPNHLDSDSHLFVYGTAATEGLTNARDIDLFAITRKPRSNVAVRLETTIQFSERNEKTASLYIISRCALLSDILEHSCGGRWTVVGLHGLWGESQIESHKYIAACLASVFYHFEIPDLLNDDEVVRAVTRALCVRYPFYAKSALSIARSPEKWRKVANSLEMAQQSSIYKVIQIQLRQHGKRITAKEQQSRYFTSETWSRPRAVDSSTCSISSLHRKIERTIGIVEQDAQLLDNTFGIGTADSVFHGLNSISTWPILQADTPPSIQCECEGRCQIILAEPWESF